MERDGRIMRTPFYQRVIAIVKDIPEGKVATYGQIAALAGNARGARQVVRALHASSRNEGLPWHRVINAKGRISLEPGRGYELQKAMLMREGVEVGRDGCIDLAQHQWK